MARHKDGNWGLPETLPDWELVPVALLMDIRDELKALNAHLRCHNFVQIPTILRGIRRKLPTRRPRRKATT